MDLNTLIPGFLVFTCTACSLLAISQAESDGLDSLSSNVNKVLSKMCSLKRQLQGNGYALLPSHYMNITRHPPEGF